MLERRFSIEEEVWWQKKILSEEDHRSMGTEWKGGYRWFKAPNVVPIEHYRRPEPTPQKKAS
jgi:hypothetical protein